MCCITDICTEYRINAYNNINFRLHFLQQPDDGARVLECRTETKWIAIIFMDLCYYIYFLSLSLHHIYYPSDITLYSWPAQPIARAQTFARDTVYVARGDIWNEKTSFNPFPNKVKTERQSNFENLWFIYLQGNTLHY